MGRAPCCAKTGLKKGRWTEEEDQLLVSYIKANGEGSWRSLPKNAGLLRCGKSCRLRWINYLREDLKRGNISEEEEETILKLQASLGNRWSVIASHLPGRTDNEIKNHWNAHLSKKICKQAVSSDATSKKSIKGSAKRRRRGTSSQTAVASGGIFRSHSTTNIINFDVKDNNENAMAIQKGQYTELPFNFGKETDETKMGGSSCSSLRLACEFEDMDQEGGTTSSDNTSHDIGESGEGERRQLMRFEGSIDDIAWEDEDNIWQKLWDGGEVHGVQPVILNENDLESWLLSDVV